GPRRGNGPRPRRRLCGWAHRPARHARDGRVLLLSRRPPRPRHRGRARAEPRPRDPRRRGGLHADLRPRRPRPRPGAQGARVRRGDAGPRRERPRRGPSPHPPEPRLGAHRAGEHRAVVGRPHRGLALLPRALRPAADALVRGRRAGDRLLVARQTGAGPIGLAWVMVSRILTGAAYLRLLLVADGRQRRGLGGRLLAAAESEARTAANHLLLLVTTGNVGARRFYERRGYRHVGDLPGLARPDLDEALYQKALRPHRKRLPV